ncbi:DegT/DnrJ/EryC1/StrS family aminotransferase [Occallatibacter riparius]|uniref:DegT/DnrJ/EryC1/StrS family aminotransferase n=1 Tax=Occallatibacter riparius TaxID=1002689 RepID=A0A9J7BXU5_9BACT|nr:DegT/DnrJ/EryC1/StrS family aminotransferase [Occallatibacter riparius]UWZ85910.1 DegT/DnrJ/EryC1/StrS family aminotransferase [Occallatibacter riparius]
MKIPLLDLKAQYATIRDEVMQAVSEVLESQVCILGPKVEELEKKVAALSACKYAVGMSSGTDALLAALMALNIGTGDEVITTPFTFFATAGCVARVGATPVFVDIDPGTFNINPALIEAAITPQTKAIIPVHLFGQMCDMDPIMEIANRHNIPVIEDAAQAISATYKGRRAGSIGAIGCFSFFPSKNLGGAGDGGMCVTNDAVLHEQLLLMRSHGSKPKYYHKVVGGNFRLDPLQAAVLLVKLPHLDEWSAARRRNAALYDEAFAGSPVVTPHISPDCVSIFNQYSIRVQNRDAVRKALTDANVGTEIYYPVPMHLQECFAGKHRAVGSLAQSEKAANEVLALPIYPELTAEQIAFAAQTVKDAVRQAQPV